MILAAKRLNPQQLLDEFSKQSGWIWVIAVSVILLLLIALAIKLKEWTRPNGLLDDSPERLLMSFRDIHKQGDLSIDEYNTIRERLRKKSDGTGRREDAASGPSAGDSAGNPIANEQ